MNVRKTLILSAVTVALGGVFASQAFAQSTTAETARDIHQQQRVAQGQAAGTLNDRQVGSLERGQAHVDTAEAHAGKNGHVSKGEQAGIQHRENHQSQRIHQDKTNG
ncbi:hypothetical protein [Pandoraea communis]|uniref:Uncharacterized protein n=1 Tax=Pandoraea communis TaxID=2508297 RepID=A0A5E4SBT4_9BURK|nr:hypothetical protein [Pandoraea communis]MDM8354664.1 hypothetical protein [Pandoraea communis]VVD71479.1 hypothetical protein PCO31111_00644 [Pandoraea communis]